VKNTGKTYAVTILLLGAVFGVNFGLNSAKEALNEDAKGKSGSEANVIRLFSALMSFIVVSVNLFLSKIIRYLSSFEKHDTYTNYNLSVASKLTFALFINTGILPIFINI
jgi:hypothetical protein